MRARESPMSRRRTGTSRVRTLSRRLLRAQLRLKVMAGVVVVTLVALVAFDVGAVSTMRRKLLNQSDHSLQVALTLTVPRLTAILSGGSLSGRSVTRPGVAAQFEAPTGSRIPALPGAFDIVYLPVRGGPVTLQVAATAGTSDFSWTQATKAAKVAVAPGPHTLVGPNGRMDIRIQSVRVSGGSLVVGTSLAQVAKTID